MLTRTKKPQEVPIRARKPIRNVNQSVATPPKKIIVQIIIFIVDSGCAKHMTGNLKRLCNFVEKYLGNDLLTGTHGSDLYTIPLQDLSSPTPICLLEKASPTQAWINYVLVKWTKQKRSSFKTIAITRSKKRLDLLHMNLCGPMRVESINGKKYILVIVDDYSRYTWTRFLRSKDEKPELLKDFLKMIQRNLQAQVITVRIDRGTEFLNKTLHAYFKEEEIEHQTSTPRTPE
ncbi:retrovirus-related pol polyprotein from transposon TNT 1-94 [Tanacetum coccineum]